MMEEFTKAGPFNSDWSPKMALAYIADLKEQLARMKEKEDDLRANLALFGFSLPENEELKTLEKVTVVLNRRIYFIDLV